MLKIEIAWFHCQYSFVHFAILLKFTLYLSTAIWGCLELRHVPIFVHALQSVSRARPRPRRCCCCCCRSVAFSDSLRFSFWISICFLRDRFYFISQTSTLTILFTQPLYRNFQIKTYQSIFNENWTIQIFFLQACLPLNFWDLSYLWSF